ncbi:hypothetical protein C5167_026747, partial [Papaver somniferum]
ANNILKSFAAAAGNRNQHLEVQVQIEPENRFSKEDEEETSIGAAAANFLFRVQGSANCLFCQIARSLTSNTLLHTDDKVVAFEDINPSAFSFAVSHMLNVGQDLVHRDAPEAEEYKFGFHRPPFNSVDHLHLHCFALPFIPRWKHVKYVSLGPLGGFIEAEKLLQKIKP